MGGKIELEDEFTGCQFPWSGYLGIHCCKSASRRYGRLRFLQRLGERPPQIGCPGRGLKCVGQVQVMATTPTATATAHRPRSRRTAEDVLIPAQVSFIP